MGTNWYQWSRGRVENLQSELNAQRAVLSDSNASGHDRDEAAARAAELKAALDDYR